MRPFPGPGRGRLGFAHFGAVDGEFAVVVGDVPDQGGAVGAGEAFGHQQDWHAGLEERGLLDLRQQGVEAGHGDGAGALQGVIGSDGECAVAGERGGAEVEAEAVDGGDEAGGGEERG